MTTWSLVSTATVVSASPNTQLVLARLALSTTAAALSTTAAWPHVLNVTASPETLVPYFDAPAGWPFSPVLVGP